MTIDIDIMNENDCYGNAVCYIPMVSWTITDKDSITPERMNEIKRDLECILSERLKV